MNRIEEWITMIVFFLIIAPPVFIGLISYFIRAYKYGGITAYPEKPKKMKFITKLQNDEVVEKLRQHSVSDIFEYEFKREDDMVYILNINKIEFWRVPCYKKAKYRIVIKPEEKNTALYIILCEADSDYAIERYGWEMKGFMEKKIMAVRIEWGIYCL